MPHLKEYDPDIHILSTPDDIGNAVAEKIANLITIKPNAVLGMATGDTPLPIYRALVKLHKQGLDFSRVRFFNLDEYIGLPADHPQSYRYYMQHNLFDLINVRPENIFIPNGMAPDILQECANYERALAVIDRIDLQLVGVGENGHLGFCEPDIDPELRTHLALLTEHTRKNNARFFNRLEDVPTHAISMGIANMLEAHEILFLATGAHKAPAVDAARKAPISPACPAAYLRLHEKVYFILDKEAFGSNLASAQLLHPPRLIF